MNQETMYEPVLVNAEFPTISKTKDNNSDMDYEAHSVDEF